MKKLSVLMILVSLMVLVSCEKVLKFDSKYQTPRLVVNALLLKDSLIKIDLSTSRMILDNAQTSTVSGANIKLYKNGAFLETINERDGKYVSTHRAEEGAVYSIEASAKDFETVTGETSIPHRVPILSLDTATMSDEYGSESLHFSLQFPVQSNQDEYFFLRCRLNKQQKPQNYPFSMAPQRIFIATNDLIKEGTFNTAVLFSNRLIDTDTYTFKGSINTYVSDTSYLKFEFCSLNKEMYDYFITLDMHDDAQGDPMMEPVIVYSNMSNGMGILGGGATVVDSIQLIPNLFMY